MSIKLKGSSDGSVSFDAPADTSPSGSDITLTLPTSAGSANQFLKNSGIAGELEYSSMVETSTGVGIGTASPQNNLVVSNAGAAGVEVFFADSGASGAIMAYNRSTSSRTSLYLTGEDLRFQTGGSDRARLDSSGRLLIGTTSDTTAPLVVKGAAGSGSDGVNIISGSTTVNSQAAIYFSPSTTGSNSTGSAIKATRISGDGSDLRFETCTALGNASVERMRIDKDGKLTLKSSFSDSSRNTVIQIECNNQGRGKLISGNSDTDPATLGASSDRRLKTNIRNYTGGLERIRQIPVKIYDEVNTSATDVISWVADEVAPIFPEAVIGEANAVDADGNPEYQILSSLKFFPDLVQCVQTLIAKVETLETQNTAQQAQIDDLLARVTALEAA